MTVLPRRWNTIRSLRLAWVFRYPFNMDCDTPDVYHPPDDRTTWLRTCRVLTGMSGLRDITLHLHANFWFPLISLEETVQDLLGLLQPLLNVNVDGPFVVKVPWSARDIQRETDSEGAFYFAI